MRWLRSRRNWNSCSLRETRSYGVVLVLCVMDLASFFSSYRLECVPHCFSVRLSYVNEWDIRGNGYRLIEQYSTLR